MCLNENLSRFNLSTQGLQRQGNVPKAISAGPTLSIARVYRPPVATVIRPPGQPVGRLGISEQYVSSISSFLGVEQGAVR